MLRLAAFAATAYARRVKDHVDLQGASEATYRFRLADLGQLPATSGNFVYVRWRGDAPVILFCGAVNSLTSADRFWDHAVRAHKAESVYIRLNVARARRDTEHADLVLGLKPPMAPYRED